MLTDRATFRPIRRPRSMKRLICRLTCALALFLPDGPAAAEQEPQAQHDMVRVFLDCNRCDEDYLKKEVTFIDYVRNREDADVHVLVTIQETGGGGSQWTLKFIGLHAYQGSEQTLTYNSLQTATSDEIRTGFAEVFKVGLVRYAALSPIADRLRVTFKKLEGAEAAAAAKKKDPWNYWTYRINTDGKLYRPGTSQDLSPSRAL